MYCVNSTINVDIDWDDDESPIDSEIIVWTD